MPFSLDIQGLLDIGHRRCCRVATGAAVAALHDEACRATNASDLQRKEPEDQLRIENVEKKTADTTKEVIVGTRAGAAVVVSALGPTVSADDHLTYCSCRETNSPRNHQTEANACVTMSRKTSDPQAAVAENPDHRAYDGTPANLDEGGEIVASKAGGIAGGGCRTAACSGSLEEANVQCQVATRQQRRGRQLHKRHRQGDDAHDECTSSADHACNRRASHSWRVVVYDSRGCDRQTSWVNLRLLSVEHWLLCWRILL